MEASAPNSIVGQKLFIILFFYHLLIILFLFSGVILAYANLTSEVQLLTSDQSYPLFADCGATFPGDRGALSLGKLTPNQSANTVLLDNDTSTKIAGKAVFELSFREGGIINGPGDDLIVFETTNPEPFMMSVFDLRSNRFTSMKQFLPVPTENEQKNICGANVNAARIDLGSFGISKGERYLYCSLITLVIQMVL